jgi:hypothetical protein
MIRATITIAFSFWALNVAADTRVLQQVQLGYEVDLANVTLPVSAAGTVSFRTCGTCQTEIHAVSADTTYSVNGRRLAFKDFGPAILNLRASIGPGNLPMVALSVDIESQTVKRIAVYAGK